MLAVAGEFVVRFASKGVLLKVAPPQGRGAAVKVAAVVEQIERRGFPVPDLSVLESAIAAASNAFVVVGDVSGAGREPAPVRAHASKDGTKAYINMAEPQEGQLDADVDLLLAVLDDAGVKAGIQKDRLEDLFENPVYDQPVVVAVAQSPENGKNAEIVVEFDQTVDRSKLLAEIEGRVDYRELSIISTVEEGQLLATKKPATSGVSGFLVTGVELVGKSGADVALHAGKNTRLSEDGLQVFATAPGRPALRKGRVDVEPECVLQDVNLETGNINFNGAVSVRGSVEDDFTVEATGPILVRGGVGASRLISGDDIIVTGGIHGKGHSLIRAGGNVYAKFLEDVFVEAGGGVYVTGGIMHSKVDAGDEVVCVARRGTIFGGCVRAGLRVEAKKLGSVATPPTEIQVGMDPAKRERLRELAKLVLQYEHEQELLQANLRTLQKNVKAKQSVLSLNKQEQLKTMLQRDKELQTLIQRASNEVATIEKLPYRPGSNAQIIVRERAFPNVTLQIGHTTRMLDTEHPRVVFAYRDEEIVDLPTSSATAPIRPSN